MAYMMLSCFFECNLNTHAYPVPVRSVLGPHPWRISDLEGWGAAQPDVSFCMGFSQVGGDWNMFYDFPYTGNVIIPIDEHIFFRGVDSTTNHFYT